MLRFLGIVVLVIIALILAFFITRFVLIFKYGWPAKIPFYIVEFVTVNKNSNYFAIAYCIDGDYYRLKLREFKTFEDAQAHVDSIVDAVNRYSTKKKLIRASHHITDERLLSITDLELVPKWVTKFMNFNINL